ncbi:MAG TPA: penicillin acylase family protein, partial [Flavitalea sp.]|nr:penicillin acylase family protein [Flavitalea sp.]
MRIVPFIVSTFFCILLIYLFSISLGPVPPLGKFLSPQHGFWQNAEDVDRIPVIELGNQQLSDKVTVYLDNRLVPHVFAQHENDAFFVQGYLHAKFRLWQMEFQTHAAAGRLSEILGAGEKGAILNYDRNMRRMGMVYAAERSLMKMESDPVTKNILDSYTAGINSYLSQLKKSELPFEYKLLNYEPEKWTNLKIALFLKYMSYELTADENDIEYTNARGVFSKSDFDKLYPITQDSLDPIVPKGTIFLPPAARPVPPSTADSLYYNYQGLVNIHETEPDKDNGSNNWAVNGTKTRSGKPILCNDPHLGLNLPSLWYEIQITTPEFNVYGASFPGAPSVIIGFNDSCAWGVTNGMRDVKDYYEIKFRDDGSKKYLFNGNWEDAEIRLEEYKVKGAPVFRDTVAYTVFGPVMYDQSYNGSNRAPASKNLAVRWSAHDPSNELRTFYLLNHAKNYQDYLDAIKTFVCPSQNFIFASKSNEIAIWQQGLFPAKWERQGDFVMPGVDSSYQWQAEIPQQENPHLVNPTRGFVSSANQLPADTTYPYYLGGHHDLFRGYLINRYLRSMTQITPADMQKLQTENFNPLAEMALPVLLRSIDISQLTDTEKQYFEKVRNWNLRNDPKEEGATIFRVWYDSLENAVWKDELEAIHGPYEWPSEYTLAEVLRRDSAFSFFDNVHTETKETLADDVLTAFRNAVPALHSLDIQGKLSWSAYKATGIRHLLRMAPLSRFNLTTGGGTHVINATKDFHGPSWRMIVHLTKKAEAYGIYPGGQSGNPGSAYYDSFVDDWAAGKYNVLWVMTEKDGFDRRV